jgi:hypothetical protein
MPDRGNDMPPASNADPMKSDTVRLPVSVWDTLRQLAEASSEKPSELYRRVIMFGIAAEQERQAAALRHQEIRLSCENKTLINQRLNAKESGAIEAVNQLEAEGADPAAVALLRLWLSE